MRSAWIVLVVWVGACGASAVPRRSLLTDDLAGYSSRRDVTAQLLGAGWCMARSGVARDVYQRCPADADLWLAMHFRGEHLVAAVLLAPLGPSSRSRTVPTDGPARVSVAGDPFHDLPERDVWMAAPPAPTTSGGRSLERDLFDALAAEWRARYGAPLRAGATWAEWHPSATLHAVVAVTPLGVAEIYVFDPDAVQDGKLVASR